MDSIKDDKYKDEDETRIIMYVDNNHISDFKNLTIVVDTHIFLNINKIIYEDYRIILNF